MNTATELQHAIRYSLQQSPAFAESIRAVLEATESGPLKELEHALFMLAVDCRMACRTYADAKAQQERQLDTLQYRTDEQYVDRPLTDEEGDEEKLRETVAPVRKAA